MDVLDGSITPLLVDGLQGSIHQDMQVDNNVCPTDRLKGLNDYEPTKIKLVMMSFSESRVARFKKGGVDADIDVPIWRSLFGSTMACSGHYRWCCDSGCCITAFSVDLAGDDLHSVGYNDVDDDDDDEDDEDDAYVEDLGVSIGFRKQIVDEKGREEKEEEEYDDVRRAIYIYDVDGVGDDDSDNVEVNVLDLLEKVNLLDDVELAVIYDDGQANVDLNEEVYAWDGGHTPLSDDDDDDDDAAADDDDDDLSAPNCAIWLRLRFVMQIANRKSLAIWDSVNLLRTAHCSDLLNKKLALRF